MPTAFDPPERLREDLASARRSFPDLGSKPLPIGVGFIAWLLDTKPDAAKELVDVALESNVQALWLAFGNDVYRWIEYVRTSSAALRAANRPLLFVQVTSVDEALVAANQWKVDVIVAQGASRLVVSQLPAEHAIPLPPCASGSIMAKI